MRRSLLIAAVAALSACPPAVPPNPVPPDRFYFPTGLVHVDAPLDDAGTSFNSEGILYVANANFDKRFDNGSVVAVDLSRVGVDTRRLPPFGQAVGAEGPRQIKELNLAASSVVQVASFAGEMAALPRLDGGSRLFLPTRSEGHRLYAIEAPLQASGTAPTLNCFTPKGSGANLPVGQDCTPAGQSLVSNEDTETGVPRAPAPIGIGISARREVWVTSLQQADSPRSSTKDFRAYLVRVDGDEPVIDDSSFINLGPGATNSVVIGQRYAYATGRFITPAANLVRMIDTAGSTLTPDGGRTFPVFSSGLESSYMVLDSRGAALSSDESRLYLAGRLPDSLVIASVSGKDSAAPILEVQRAVPLPEGPNTVVTIPRDDGRSDLVVIVCSTAGVVAFYDDDTGNVVAQVAGVGLQPWGVAVDRRPTGGARLYVSNFTDGRIAVIDVPDLVRPQSARIVAHLGDTQLCLTRGVREPACDGGTR